MIEYPKYTIVTANRDTLPYVILEHSSGLIPGGIGEEELLHKMHSSYETFEEALKVLARLSDGPIVLAVSAQLLDNTFDIRGY